MCPFRTVPKTPSKRSAQTAGRARPAAPEGPGVVQATAAKNRFGAILNRARSGEAVVIAKRGVPESVVLTYPRYHSLVHNTRGRAALATSHSAHFAYPFSLADGIHGLAGD
jgi:prevent-host-death family protein